MTGAECNCGAHKKVWMRFSGAVIMDIGHPFDGHSTDCADYRAWKDAGGEAARQREFQRGFWTFGAP